MKLSFLSLILLTMVQSVSASSDVLVITNKARTQSIQEGDLRDIYWGKKRTIADWNVYLIDQSSSQPAHIEFYRLLFNKDSAEVKTRWAELVFSGRARPPQVVANDAAVISQV